MADYTPSRLVRSFEQHLRAENRSERTVENYLESPHQAEVFLCGRGRRLEDASKADLEDFLADLLARRSASTAATRYKVLRILYRWLEEEEDVPSPMARMKPPIIPDQPIPVIPDNGQLPEVVVLPPHRQLGHVRHHPPRPPGLRWRERTHPWCIALLRRFRVERRANGEASSVMARTSERGAASDQRNIASDEG